MGMSSIPVDLSNPGQVLACVGFMEAADFLCGAVECRFDWETDEEQFILVAEKAENPLAEVLSFLAEAKAFAIAPYGWMLPKGDSANLKRSDTFPAKQLDVTSLPIILQDTKGRTVSLGHWSDGSGRDEFKLYAGNRSALKIATDMLSQYGEIWKKRREELLTDPLNILCGMGGSFNFDPRGAWTGIDIGYSINDLNKVRELKQKVMASPLLEILAAWGLEYARPAEISTRLYRYAVWERSLPPQLARAALSGNFNPIRQRHFRFPLDLSGKNKIVCNAIEENAP
jgi:CRISPR-associated protein Csb3